MTNKKGWFFTPVKKALTDANKQALVNMFEPLISDYKTKFIEAQPNRDENYIVDFYCKFYREFFYLCTKYRAEYENRIADEFEVKFARLEFVGENNFNLAYFRHTGQWWTIDRNVDAKYCLENIKDNALFFS